MKTIDSSRLKMLIEREEKRYLAEHPKSVALYERAKGSLFLGVPFHWMCSMRDTPLPLFIKEAKGAYLWDVDGHRYLDLLTGDHTALYGHSPKAVADAVADQVHRGVTHLLPTEDSIWVGEELARRFGLPYWQVYITATDANNAAIKIARELTQRNIILSFNYTYHGTLEDTLVSLVDGKLVPHPLRGQMYNIGALPNPELRSRVVEPYDLGALEKALSTRDIAAVIAEPTISISFLGAPFDPSYHKALREMTRRFGTLLIYDETHTISAGPGGCTRLWNLEPDIFTLGKGIGGAMTASVMGLSQEVAERLLPLFQPGKPGVWGMGTTASGNALSVAAVRATLEHVMTESAYDRMLSNADRMVDGMEKILKTADLPWPIHRHGSFVTFFNTQEAGEVPWDSEFDAYRYVFYANRGIFTAGDLAAAIISPEVTLEDIDYHNKVFGECLNELFG